jgi:hypothetical protein
MEDFSLDRARLEHAPLCAFEGVDAGGEQGLQGRRHAHLTVCLLRHGEHLGHEERVAAGSAGDPLPQLVADLRSDQLLHLLVAERLQTQRRRPAQLAASEAEQQDGRSRREEGEVVDQVEEGLLAPVHVVEDADERCALLEQLAEGPGDLLRRGGDLALAEQRPERRRRGRIGGKRVQLLEYLDHWPVGDPSP